MGSRLQRVEEMLRREIASVVLLGELRDPRLPSASGISITAVRVAPDLATARVFVDVVEPASDRARVLAGLNASAPEIQRRLAGRIHLKRTPRLKFVEDESLTQGARIEQVLDELRSGRNRSSGGKP